MKIIFVYINLLLLLWTDIIISQNKWENIGAPNGGYVMKITEGPNKHLYAGTNSSGIFRSTDNGESWQSISRGIELYSNGIKSILATSNYIYCGTWGALYRSTNYGGNWEKITTIFNDAYIFDFELVGTNIFAATSKGLYQSSDNGVNWAYADTSLPKDEIDAIDIRNSMMVVVYNYSEGIWISTNNGKNWTLKPLQMSTFYDIIISDTTTFYAAGVDGFYKSTNLGENWQKLDKGINPLYSDGGQSIVEDKSGDIYCAQNEKVYKLNPDKLSWSVFNNGLSNNFPRSLYFSSNNKLFLGTLNNGVYYFNENDNKWIQTKFPAGLIYQFKTFKDNLYVCSTFHYFFTSLDKGNNWDKKLTIENGSVSILDENTIIAGDGNYDANRKGIQISYNKGNDWEDFNNGLKQYEWIPGDSILPTVYKIESVNSREIYALTQTGFYSGNLDNRSWSTIVSSEFGKGMFLKLSNGDFLIASGGLLQVDNGNITDLHAGAEYIVTDETNTIYFAINNGRAVSKYDYIWWGEVYKLTNDENRHELLLKLPENIEINDMKIDKLGRIYLGTSEGIYVSNNHGADWNKLDDELANVTIRLLNVDFDNRLFAISNMGIYKEVIYDTVNSMDEKIESFTLFQNYPNPFNPTTNIGFRIAEFGFVSLKVYDILGREVATLVNEEKHAGNYEVEFDGRGLSSGIYFYKIQAGNFNEVKKMVLMK